ncbi:hypothetical protein D6J04_14315, partial [Legionella taurinensis]
KGMRGERKAKRERVNRKAGVMGEREQQANATMTTRCCPARAGGQPIPLIQCPYRGMTTQ